MTLVEINWWTEYWWRHRGDPVPSPGLGPSNAARYSFAYTAPPDEPLVTVAEAKKNLRVEHTLDDDLIAGLITAATQFVSLHTGRTFVTRTARMSWVCFPPFDGALELFGGPVQAVTSFVPGTLDPLVANDDYLLWGDANPPVVYPVTAWPTDDLGGLITVAYTAGEGTADQCNPLAKAVVKLLVNHWYFHAGDPSKFDVEELPAPARAILALLGNGRYS